MNQHQSKLNQREREQEQTSEHQQATNETQAVEFASAEDALRHDAAQTPVPPRVAARLQASIQREPALAGSSWWRKLFGR
jgi:hypothetical protein